MENGYIKMIDDWSVIVVLLFLAIYKSLASEQCVSHLPLPLPVRALIASLHTQTILVLFKFLCINSFTIRKNQERR